MHKINHPSLVAAAAVLVAVGNYLYQSISKNLRLLALGGGGGGGVGGGAWGGAGIIAHPHGVLHGVRRLMRHVCHLIRSLHREKTK